MGMPTEPYIRIVVETYRESGSGLHGDIHVRTVPNEQFPQSLRVRFPKAPRYGHPIGTRFLVYAKLTDREGGGQFLHTNHAWDYEALGLPDERSDSSMKKATTPIKRSKTTAKEGKGGGSASQLIDARIAVLSDWRGETLARVRSLIREADPEMVEEVKWRKPSNSMLGVPVWEHAGIICTGETYKSAVKLTFAKGGSLKDPSCLFNASLEGNVRRAIDIHEGDKIDERTFKALIRAAVALNLSLRTTARRVHSQKRPKSS